MVWLSGSIKQRMMTYLVTLAVLSVIQCGASLWVDYVFDRSAAFQRLMGQVTARQMYGDMKHDSIQGDVFRVKDAIARQAPELAQDALKSLDDDIVELEAAHQFILSQQYADDLQPEVAKTRPLADDYIMRARAVVQEMQRSPDNYTRQFDDFIRSFKALEVQQASLSKAFAVSIEARNAYDSRITRFIEILQVVTILLSGACLVWTLLYTKRSVVGPLERLSDTLRAMAAGQLGERVEGYDNGDEIANLAKVANVFRENALAKKLAEQEQDQVVSELREALARLADKNLEYRIQSAFPQSYAELRDSFNMALDSLCAAMGTVRVGASTLAHSIGEIRSAADDLAQRNEQQADSLRRTTAAMGEVTGSVRQTAVSAQAVRSAMEKTQAEASEGGEVVQKAIAAMAAIEHSTKGITQITDLIDGIAFQTNLLALNAGVEAARAGDAGKGFAVVANEVRALAQRSADAARDIKELISSSNVQVEAGVTLVGQTGDKLLQIVSRVDEITSSINHIATSAEQQAGNLQHVNEAVGEMDQMTQQNAAMVEQTSAATRTLASEANELRELVSQFRTRDSLRPGIASDPDALRRQSIGNGPTPPSPRFDAAPPIVREAIGRAGLALAMDMDPRAGPDDDWSEF